MSPVRIYPKNLTLFLFVDTDMTRRLKKKKIKRPLDWGGYDATRPSPDRALPFLPPLDARQEVDSFDLWLLWSLSRSLYQNFPPVRAAVQAMVDLVGWLMPLPATEDATWNARAAEYFSARAADPLLFSVGGKLNWKEAQQYIERKAIIDGDNLTVLGRAKDGGGAVAFYAAPQIMSGAAAENAAAGVEVDKTGRVVAYHVLPYLPSVSQEMPKPVSIPAAAAVLYQHEPDPARHRGVPELAAVINDCLDLKDIAGFVKASIKLAASVALVETKDVQDARAEQAAKFMQRAGGCPAAASAGGNEPSLPPFAPVSLVQGTRMVSLAPGRKVQILHDSRPSNESMQFAKRLIANLAYNWGVDPELLFYVSELGSAGARFSLQKLSRRLAARRLQKENWASVVYRHILACGIAAGHLPVPNVPNWAAVRWIPQADLTIDRGREISGVINSVREGLADADRWTLATEGMTFERVIRRRAENLAAAHRAAEEHGVPMAELLPGAVGAAVVPAAEHKEDGPTPREGVEA